MPEETFDFGIIRVRRETPKAFLCKIGDGEFWVPKSQIIGGDLASGSGFLTTTLWWAQVSGAQNAFENYQLPPPPPPDLPTASIIFRRLAMKYHPDLNPDAVEFMKDINELWQAVRRDTKR